MHPHEDHQEQGYWGDEAPPDPTHSQTAAEFLAELRVLLEWSGLSLPDIEQRVRAYDEFVPEGTVSRTLRGDTLPTEQLLLSLLWAVGCDDETVEIWVWARGRLATPSTPSTQTYSEGALAHAVKERRDQSGWRGLHRRAVPDDEGGGDGRHHAKRAAGKTARRGGGSWSSRAMVGLVVAGVLAFGAGIAFALSGGGGAAAPPGQQRVDQACCPSPTGSGQPSPLDHLPGDLPTGTPAPNTSTKPVVNPTPRPTTTTQGPTQPQPTQTQPPQLDGSGGASCAGEGTQWVVTVTVSATLSGATSGSEPQGRASRGETVKTFALSGSGVSFSGTTTIDVGPVDTPVQGSVNWRAAVTVPGAGTVEDSGSASFNCAAPTS